MVLATSNIAEILSKIHIQAWNKIVEKEPEWIYMHEFLKKYGFGKFIVLMTATGLNDFQLKGKAEKAYWPQIKKLLETKPVPDSPEKLITILEEFYSKERTPKIKLKRLRKFLLSNLAKELWNSNPEYVAKNFLKIWHKLTKTMKQKGDAKTITFAMKCIGISLIMVGETNFSYEKIPIPVDSRVREFTKRLGIEFKNDGDIRNFWNSVLKELKERVNINMIHLDSLIWQIGTLGKKEIIEYFSELELENIGKNLVEILK